ncbi:MAG TPA: DUF1850 domain-containing protein [Virgibacillus sp.]|nr:DUF1850 domain-containing protein [Virgibacillus sp.]
MKALRIWLITSFLFIVIWCFIYLVPLTSALVFYEERSPVIRAYLPLEADDTFMITFTHSIHLTEVVEKYRLLETSEIEQYEMVFEQFGIGMPSVVGAGETLIYDEGKYYYGPADQVFSELKIRNGKTVSKHRLSYQRENEKELSEVLFNDYFEPGSWYTVKVDHITIWEMVKGMKINE